MFNIKLDFTNSIDIKIDKQDISLFDELSLVSYVCDILYQKHVKFIVCDNRCSDYNMDCKFDLPCLLEVFDDVVCGLLKRQDFSIEFYEQGREYYVTFLINNDDVMLDIRYGYNDTSIIEELKYCYIKEMFISLFEVLFEEIKNSFTNIESNTIFFEWNEKLSELKAQ